MQTSHTLAEEMADKIATNKIEIALNDDIINDLNGEMSNLHSENTAEAAEIARANINISENQANIMNNKALNDQNFLELNEKVLTNKNAAPVIGSIIPWIPSKIALRTNGLGKVLIILRQVHNSTYDPELSCWIKISS